MSAQATEAIKPNGLTRELWHIAGTGDVVRLRELLDEGAEANAGDASGVTALMRAAYHGQLPIVRALIESGADPNAKDRGGLTALSMARHGGHKAVVDELLACGAKAKTTEEFKPRLVSCATDEGVGVADDDSDIAAVEDDVTPSPTPNVRTLQEPPDIWDLVHTTAPDGELPAQVASGSAFAKPLIAGAVLLVCAGVVFGWWYFSGAGETSEQPAEAVATAPKVSTDQSARRAESMKETRPIVGAANDLSRLKPVAKVTSERAQVTSPVASPVALSAKKFATKTQHKTTKTAAPHLAEEPPKARAPRSSTRADTSAALKKDPGKAQAQSIDPPKPSGPPKPKVIQWP